MRHPFRAVFAALALAALPALAQDVYKIDPVHSEVSFKIRHLLAKTSGRFTKFGGTIKVDTADISKSSVEVSIDAASINTDNEGRDKHLKTADFFDVEKFPTITFKSTSVKSIKTGLTPHRHSSPSCSTVRCHFHPDFPPESAAIFNRA